MAGWAHHDFGAGNICSRCGAEGWQLIANPFLNCEPSLGATTTPPTKESKPMLSGEALWRSIVDAANN